MRRIGAVTIGQPLDDDSLTEAASDLSAAADRIEAAAARLKRRRNQPGPNGLSRPAPAGPLPDQPDDRLRQSHRTAGRGVGGDGEGGRREIRGRVTFDYPYEGPPTCVHGGVIAELFDELLGLSNILVGLGAMTGTLTIAYRRPTPLLAPLELAARHTGKEGRKVFAWGGLYHEGELTAEAEGVFIHVEPARMLEIVTGNAHGAHSAEGPLVDADWQRMMEKAARAPRDAPS